MLGGGCPLVFRSSITQMTSGSMESRLEWVEMHDHLKGIECCSEYGALLLVRKLSCPGSPMTSLKEAISFIACLQWLG